MKSKFMLPDADAPDTRVFLIVIANPRAEYYNVWAARAQLPKRFIEPDRTTPQYSRQQAILSKFHASEEASFLTPNSIDITSIVSIPFEENSFIIRFPDQTECLVVDPGLEPEKIIEHLDKMGIRPAAILITHGHSDHFAGNEALKERWPACPIVIGKTEAEKLTNPMMNLSAMFGLPLTSPPADLTVADGDIYEVVGFRLKVLEIPGHSSGHVAYQIEECQPAIVFVGDVIFAGSVGRTDFPDGSFQQLAQGIREKLFSLPDDAILHPGHGPSTTVGKEKRSNPFVGARAGD